MPTTRQLHKVNILHVSWTCVRCVRRSVALCTPSDTTTTPFTDWRSCRLTAAAVLVTHRFDDCSFQFVIWGETSLMVAHLLKGTPDGIIQRIQVQPIQWRHVWPRELRALGRYLLWFSRWYMHCRWFWAQQRRLCLTLLIVVSCSRLCIQINSVIACDIHLSVCVISQLCT